MFDAFLYFLVSMLFIAGVVYYLWRSEMKPPMAEEDSGEEDEGETLVPATLHPVISESKCVGCELCIEACPENVITLKNRKAHVANYSLCLGHGACFQNCPFDAIILRSGTDSRGDDIPHVYENFESLERGIFLAGELGGMGLMKNASEQAIEAVDNITRSLRSDHRADYDLVIAGAGTAGLSAALEAKKHNLKFIVLEQDTIELSVANYPRRKVSGTVVLNLPLAGPVTLRNASKKQITDMWHNITLKYRIPVQENCRVKSIIRLNDRFNTVTSEGQNFGSKFVLLTIGRRGSPVRPGIPGENLEKVAYRLSDPEIIRGKKILVTGSVDSVIRSALLLAGNNQVTVSCPEEMIDNLKPIYGKNLSKAVISGRIRILFKTKLVSIEEKYVNMSSLKGDMRIENDLVYIFDGGEPTSEFLERAGIGCLRMPAGEVLC